MAHQIETIVVPEIHCDHCKNSIEGALQPLAGVDSAVVDVESTKVTVGFDDTVLSRDELVQAITDQGYEVPQ